jgi:hypothetical protein
MMIFVSVLIFLDLHNFSKILRKIVLNLSYFLLNHPLIFYWLIYYIIFNRDLINQFRPSLLQYRLRLD